MEGEYAPYSRKGWEEHQRHLEELLAKIRAGKVKVRTAYVTNPNYGGYSYYEDDRITASVDYADPQEVLLVAEAAGLREVSLAGGWWPEGGFEGWGQKIPLSLARAKLPEWRAIFLGRLPSRRRETLELLRARPWLPFPDPLGIVERATEGAPVQLRDPLRGLKVAYEADLERPAHIEEVRLEDGRAVLYRFRRPALAFTPTEEQRRMIREGRGLLAILERQVVEWYPPW